MASNKVREEFCFYGRVQGVGFRYKLRHLADSYGVTGWVRNEPDGTVSMEAQGVPDKLELLLWQISQIGRAHV